MNKELQKNESQKNNEPSVIFDESVLPYLEDHGDVNMIQFFVSQFLADENHGDLILQARNFDLQIYVFEGIIYVTCTDKY